MQTVFKFIIPKRKHQEVIKSSETRFYPFTDLPSKIPCQDLPIMETDTFPSESIKCVGTTGCFKEYGRSEKGCAGYGGTGTLITPRHSLLQREEDAKRRWYKPGTLLCTAAMRVISVS